MKGGQENGFEDDDQFAHLLDNNVETKPEEQKHHNIDLLPENR